MGYGSAERRRLQQGQPFISGWQQSIWFLGFSDSRARQKFI
jgi:hypothetical protein